MQSPSASTSIPASWRHESGRILLTFLAYSDQVDPPDAQEFPLIDIDVTNGKAEAGCPSDGVTERAVAAHAFRHLAFLARMDRDFPKALFSDDTLRTLDKIAPVPAGRTL